ncbi:HARB1-like protein [Mya arenaria]|uniref:Putative nuclease HARBI1 n=2 Tax=Mya arenaria TaxID=6604 RepID=A0ABY7EV27_MYAAR|nr:HARB1-like protein [Mya arenaria]
MTVTEKILITLRYLATGGIQLNDGDIHYVSQPSVSRAVGQVIDALANPQLSRQYLKFPLTPQTLHDTKSDFYGIAGFPNVIGVIDGTHVQIKAPSHDEPAYVNRMGYHSINTQIVFDGRDNIIDIVARWPGATHDSRMLRESGLHALFLGGHVPGDHSYLLGDSGYPCKRWLLTPYVNPQPGAQTRYNSAHKTTRSRVERGIGQLKRRWGILNGEIRLKPEKACKVIIACAVLHNICKRRNIPLLDILPNAAGQVMNQGVYAGPQEGLRYREFVAQSFF